MYPTPKYDFLVTNFDITAGSTNNEDIEMIANITLLEMLAALSKYTK